MVDGAIDETAVVKTDAGVEEITIGTNIYVFDFNHNASEKTNRWRLRWEDSTLEAMNAPEMLDMDAEGEGNRDEENPSGTSRAFRDDVRGHAGGIWAERRNSRTLRDSGAVTGGHLRTEDSRVRFGFDLPAQSFMGGDLVLGAGVLQGVSLSDVSSPEGESVIGIENHAASLTASWWSPAGFYVDGQTRYVRFSRGISVDGLSRIQAHEGAGVNVAAELGYRFAVLFGGMDFEVVPRMRLAWSRVGFEDYISSRGGLVSLEDGELFKGRLGLSWVSEWHGVGGSGRIYGGVNLRDALDGRTAVRATGVLITSKQSSSVDGRLGASYEWDDGYSFYGEAKALRQGDVEAVSANMRMRVDF